METDPVNQAIDAETSSIERSPDVPDLWIAQARLARQRGDIEAAAAAFAALRVAAPDELEGYVEGAGCLRELGRVAVAEGVLSDGLARFPEVPVLAIDFARIAEEQANLHEAWARWGRVCERFPDDPQGYLGLHRSLTALHLMDEAEEALRGGIAHIPHDVDLAVAHAWAADYRDRTEALRRMEAAVARFPDEPSPLFGKGALLRELDYLDEADAALSAALERFPGHVDVLVNYAHVAAKRGDRAEESRRWLIVITAHPDLVDGHLGYAAALADSGRIRDAEGVLAEAGQRFPANPSVLADFARLAHRRSDWQQSLRRWETFRERFPEAMTAYPEMAEALRELGRFDDADSFLTEAAAKHPENGDIVVSYAWVAHYREDWPEALRRWDDALQRFPEDPSPWFGKGALLREIGRLEEADEILSEAVRRYPDHEDALVNYARVAQTRGDWGEALLRWEAVYARFPDLAEAVEGREIALAAFDSASAAPSGTAGKQARDSFVNGEGDRAVGNFAADFPLESPASSEALADPESPAEAAPLDPPLPSPSLPFATADPQQSPNPPFPQVPPANLGVAVEQLPSLVSYEYFGPERERHMPEIDGRGTDAEGAPQAQTGGAGDAPDHLKWESRSRLC